MRFHRVPWAVLFLVLGVSFGSASRAVAQDKVIAEGDTWKYFKGTENPDVDWKTVGFDDSAWLEGATPIGYSTDLAYKTVLTDMQNSYWSIYTRKKFNVSTPGAIKALKLRMKYDDGFVAYLNGVEVLRKFMNAGDPINTTAAMDHETNTAFEDSTLPCSATESVVGGDNVLAIEVHNGTLGSSDLSFSVELDTLAAVCPTNLTCTVNASNQVLLKWTKPLGFTYEALVLLRNGAPVTPAVVKSAVSYTDRTPVNGVNDYRLVATVCGKQCSGADAPECSVTLGGGAPQLRRGDTDQNGSLGINDAVVILNSLFRDGGPLQCPDSGDVDDDGNLNLTDPIYLLRFQFQGGPSPPPPLGDCGLDTTVDTLSECTYAGCP